MIFKALFDFRFNTFIGARVVQVFYGANLVLLTLAFLSTFITLIVGFDRAALVSRRAGILFNDPELLRASEHVSLQIGAMFTLPFFYFASLLLNRLCSELLIGLFRALAARSQDLGKRHSDALVSAEIVSEVDVVEGGQRPHGAPSKPSALY